jgi:hypothetical protein
VIQELINLLGPGFFLLQIQTRCSWNTGRFLLVELWYVVGQAGMKSQTHKNKAVDIWVNGMCQ